MKMQSIYATAGDTTNTTYPKGNADESIGIGHTKRQVQMCIFKDYSENSLMRLEIDWSQEYLDSNPDPDKAQQMKRH